MFQQFLFLIPIFILIFFIIKYKNAHIASIIASISVFLILKIFISKNNNELRILAIESIGSIIFSLDYIFIILFIFMITLTTFILINSGMMEGYKYFVKNFIKSKKLIELNIFFTSLLMSIDDYLSMMSIKNFFGPLISSYNISKEKFSFLISSISAPSTCISPFSTYAAVYLVQLRLLKDLLNINDSIYKLFLNSIVFYIFPILILIFVFTRAFLEVDYKNIDIENKNLNLEDNNDFKKNYNIKDIFIVFIPVIFIFLRLLYSFFNLKKNNPNENISTLLGQLNLPSEMFIGIFIGFLILLLVLKNKLKNVSIFLILRKSLFETYNTLLMSISRLILCWIFSKTLMLLVDMNFISITLSKYKLISSMLPFLFSLLGLLGTVITSSSWASVGIITPLIAVFSYYENIPLLFGALVSGSISGLYITPLSDVIEIPSIITDSNFIDFYKMQLKENIKIILLSLIVFIFLGFFKFNLNLMFIFWILLISLIFIYYLIYKKIFINKKYE